MEYNPKYPQPFSLSQAIALDPAVASDEIARLKNSLLHLKRSQSELQEYLQELAPGGDLEVSQAVKDNEITMASQDERIFMLKLALAHHGHSVASGQTSSSDDRASRSQNVLDSNSNDSNSLSLGGHTSATNLQTPQADEAGGLYL